MSYAKIAKNASIYTVFSIFSKAINFLLLPIYTSYLTTADYGIVGIITALTAFLSTIYLLSLNGSINRFYIEYRTKNKVLNALYSTIFTTVILNATLWTIVSIVGARVFSYILPGINFYPYIFWGLLTVWLKPIYLLYQRILQAQQNGKKVALLDFSYAILNIILTIIFVVGLKQKAEGVIKAQTITAFIIAITIIFIFLRKLKWDFSKILFKRTLKYSLPLIPHSLAGITSTMIDRFVINKYLGAGDVGVYNIAYQFGNLSNILTAAFNQAYVPWFNEQIKLNNQKQIVKVAKLATLVFSLFAMGISIFSKEILQLFAKGDFLQGAQYIPYLAFAYVLNGIYFIYATDLFYDISGRGVKKLAAITIFSALVNLSLNLLFVPRWGILGAAIAFIITKLVFALITGLIVGKKAHAQIKVSSLIIIALLFFTTSLGFQIYLTLFYKIFGFTIILAIITYFVYRNLMKIKSQQ